MRIASATKLFLLVLGIALVVSSKPHAASLTPPESWQDLPVMYDKGQDGRQNLRWYTDIKQKEVFTFGALLEQIKSEADGQFEWVACGEEGCYRLKTVFLRKIKAGQTKSTPVELTFRACLNEEKNQKGIELAAIFNPENQKIMTGKKVEGLLYPWFKRYF